MQSTDPTFIPSTQSGFERRALSRAELLVQVECKATGVNFIAQCQNISETGMLVNTCEPFAPSTDIKVSFALPTPRALTIAAKGVVVRVNRGKTMAIRFLELNRRHRNSIADLVERAAL